MAFQRLSLPYSIWHIGERSWQIHVGWNSHSLTCLLTGKWVGTQSYLYFPKQPARDTWVFLLMCGTLMSAGKHKRGRAEPKPPDKLTSPRVYYECFPGYFRLRYSSNKNRNTNSPTLSPACWAGLSSCTLHTNVHISTEFWSWWCRP